MKLRLLISTLIAILVTFSCSKNDTKKHSVSNLSQLKGNRSLKNLKKIDQLKELMDGNAKAKIACYISSDAMNIAWGGKPYYDVTGYVDDSNPDDSYDLTIGKSCIRKSGYDKPSAKHYFFSTPEQLKQNDFSDLFGQKQSVSLGMNGKNIFADGIYTPTPIYLDTIDREAKRNKVVIKWNTDETNTNGVVIELDAHDQKGGFIGKTYNLVDDKDNHQDISEMIAEFPEQDYFTVAVMRGNYVVNNTENGDKYILAIISRSTHYLKFK